MLWTAVFVYICYLVCRQMADEEMTGHDMTTTLRSELAALQYKRDRLLSEVSLLI